jgi:hypothetical protein
MGAFAIPAIAGITSGVLNSIFGNKASSELAAGSINAANNANSILSNQNQLNRSDLAPYTQTGSDAITRLGSLLGIGPKPGSAPVASAGPAGLPADAQAKQSEAKFLQDWLAGKNPVGQDGKHIGGAPSNAATRAKVQGQLDQDLRDVQTAQEIASNTARQQTSVDSGNPADYGKLLQNFSAADFTKDPGYDFRLSEGNKALERSAAAKGGVQSGGTLKALTDYNQNFASNEYNNAYNRFNTDKLNTANLLLGTAGMGQVSLGQQANLGTATAGQIADNTANGITGAANATASGYINNANTANSTIGNLMNLYNLYKTGQNPSGSTGSLPGGGTYNGAIDMSSSIPVLRNRGGIIVN